MFVSTLVASLFATAAFAAPVTKPSEIDIMQFALTLEHLENAFYTGALAKFDEQAFNASGFPPLVRERFVQISEHEATHVQFLTAAIGAGATQPCTYSFPYTDVKSFATMSQISEGVGVTAYLGAAHFPSNPDHLTAAASILSTEARQASWVASAVNKDTPWSGSFDVPLDLDQAFSLAASFIVSCPSTNPNLPVKAFPSLSVSPAAPTAGSEVTLTFEASSSSDSLFLAIFTGLSVEYVPIQNGSATLPQSLNGAVYIVVTSSSSAITDENTIAGPAVLLLPDNE